MCGAIWLTKYCLRGGKAVPPHSFLPVAAALETEQTLDEGFAHLVSTWSRLPFDVRGRFLAVKGTNLPRLGSETVRSATMQVLKPTSTACLVAVPTESPRFTS